ncbi:unnamed protein product [Allacma fusca]|uniref:Uncharacterized protein n=1 Tax=Allacma fusca TaxID=39272 RepID=A0A8J2KQ28_9HEXA|nr:unnamed protein product [Allacma fusca]
MQRFINRNNKILRHPQEIEASTTPDSDTCQCGVFLLGSPPLEFSADAKPVLSGHPVTANCSLKDDRISCATICRQLIQAMSESHENTPLVQTVVLAATRTLACQRFNESHKVPLPRTILGSDHHAIAKLDESRKAWKFIVGPLPRREIEGENEESNTADEETNSVGKLSQPKWLGGFYRWCDSQWVYAGVSLQEPLCCLKHLPKKCPSFRKEADPEPQSTSEVGTARNGRQPRLIIKKRPEDDLSSEEQDLQPLEDGATTSAEKIPPTTSTLSDSSSETEGPFGNASSEVIHVFDNMETDDLPNKRKPLNSTVLAEAFQFVGALMRSLGFGEVADGVAHVLPASTASDLLERIDVGGWVGTYQDKYVMWSREFNLGYCYVEYGLYNIASDGFVATTSNLIARLFKSNSQPPSMSNHMNNYISPMSSMSDNFKSAFPGHPGLPGNRRVRRSEPNVSVSRSYTSVGGRQRRLTRTQTQARSPLEQLASIARIETASPLGPPPVSTPTIEKRYSQQQYQPMPQPLPLQHQHQPSQQFPSQHMPIIERTTESVGESRKSSQPPRARRQPEKTHNQSQHKVKQSGKDASTGQLMNLASALVQTAMGGSEVDKVSLIMQNALPLVSQVATSPMIQGMVSNLVTSFLTPPRSPPVKGGQGQGPTGPTGSSTMPNNVNPSGPSRKPVREPVESNEINDLPVSSSSNRPSQSAPSMSSSGPSGESGPSGGSGGLGGSGGIASLFSQIVQTYLKHQFSSGFESKPPPRPQNIMNTKPQKTTGSSSASSSSTVLNDDEKTGDVDVVSRISEVAKPFFISYFGVVPDVPGFGQLSISERRDRPGSSKDSTAYLTNDPDPGTGITDLVFGSPNLPETGNPVFDFGNRVAYAFSRANDPLQGLYCFKQYAVNKMWDYFRVGVRTLFKRDLH